MSILIWGTIIFFNGLYVSLIFNHNIWTDEAFTLQLITGNFREIVVGTARDVHPPLYYIFAKLVCLVFGKDLQALKILSILFMLCWLVFITVKMRKLFGDVATFFAILFMTCIPCSMEFATQLRMYTLAIFCVTAAGIYAYEVYLDNSKKSWILLIIYTVASAYTHYFAFVAVIAVNALLCLVILSRKKELIKRWLIAAVIMVILYIPWIKEFMVQVTAVTSSYWIPDISFATIWGYLVWLFDLELVLPGTAYIFTIGLIILMIDNIRLIVKNKEKDDWFSLGCYLVPILTTIAGVILSLILIPIFRDQYVYPAIGLLAVFFGIRVKNYNKYVLVAITIFLLFVGAIQYKECFRQEYRSTYEPQTTAFFEANVEEDDFILYNWETFGFIYREHYPDYELVYSGEFDFGQDFRVGWLMATKYNDLPTQEALDAYGLVMEHVGHYGIEHNEFEIYKIYHADDDIQWVE